MNLYEFGYISVGVYDDTVEILMSYRVCLSQILLVPQMAAVIILEFASNFACLYLVDYSLVPVLLAFS